jgi:hypothetical protein
MSNEKKMTVDNVNPMSVAEQYLYYINRDVDRYKNELKRKNKTKEEINQNFENKVSNPPKFKIFIKCLKKLKFEIRMRDQYKSILRAKYDKTHTHNYLNNDAILSRYVYSFDQQDKTEEIMNFELGKLRIVVKYEVTPKDYTYHGKVTFKLINASDLVYAYFSDCIYQLKDSPSKFKLKFRLEGIPLKSLYIPDPNDKTRKYNVDTLNVNTLNVNTLNDNTLYYKAGQPVVFVYKTVLNRIQNIFSKNLHLYVNIESDVTFTGDLKKIKIKSQHCYFVTSNEYNKFMKHLEYNVVNQNLYKKPKLFDISNVLILKRNAAHHLRNMGVI